MPNREPNETERYLLSLQKLMREAVKKAQYYDAEWNDLNERLNVKFRSEGVKDIVQLTRLKSVNIPLADAFASGNWWRDKATYLASVIQAEVALRGGVGL